MEGLAETFWEYSLHWKIANGLPWGPQEPDDPLIPWLRHVAEVSLDTRRSAMATAELIDEWRAENPDDERSDRALSMAFSAKIPDVWPDEIQRKQVRHSENLTWTSKRGKTPRCRGVRFYSLAPPDREDLVGHPLRPTARQTQLGPMNSAHHCAILAIELDQIFNGLSQPTIKRSKRGLLFPTKRSKIMDHKDTT